MGTGATGGGATGGGAASGGTTQAGGGLGLQPEAGAGAGGVAGSTDDGAPSYGAPTLGRACKIETELACDGAAQKLPLLCKNGVWQANGTCSASENCDQQTGLCEAIVAECVGKQPNAQLCTTGEVLKRCGPDLVTLQELKVCEGKCVAVDSGAACAPASCGDGKVQAPEECDDGNQVNTDSCTNACNNAMCGDGAVWVGHESCDDGNNVATDDCNACAAAKCGDGSTWAGHEECDDANGVTTDNCNDCKLPKCGDGAPWAGHEPCDDGNSVTTDACNACKPASCGDGVIWGGHEECDDGAAKTDCIACKKTTTLFSGRNVYAPTLMRDGQEYKMWYGGWQTDGDFPNDRIYYRTSSDNQTWSAPVTVLTPSQIPAPSGKTVVHVNDPSVTKHQNAVNGVWQYTMFYTVCVAPCEQRDNQIWSAVSADGITWEYPQALLAGDTGPSEPSAIVDSGTGGFWKVYYVDRLNATKVQMATVTGDRQATAVQIVYSGSQTLSGSEVRFFNGKWHLFNNLFSADHVDIGVTTSNDNTLWQSALQPLFTNTNTGRCATVAPGVLPAEGNQYDLYFGLSSGMVAGSCDLSKQQSIQRWRVAE